MANVGAIVTDIKSLTPRRAAALLIFEALSNEAIKDAILARAESILASEDWRLTDRRREQMLQQIVALLTPLRQRVQETIGKAGFEHGPVNWMDEAIEEQ